MDIITKEFETYLRGYVKAVKKNEMKKNRFTENQV